MSSYRRLSVEVEAHSFLMGSRSCWSILAADIILALFEIILVLTFFSKQIYIIYLFFILLLTSLIRVNASLQLLLIQGIVCTICFVKTV